MFMHEVYPSFSMGSNEIRTMGKGNQKAIVGVGTGTSITRVSYRRNEISDVR